MASLREQILDCDDIETVRISVPEWRCHVTLRGWTGAERERWETEYQAAKDKDTVRAVTAAMACRDDDGNLIFTLADVDRLARKSAPALQRIYNAVIEMNAVSKQDVEDLEGN